MTEEYKFKSSYFLRMLSGDYNPFTPNNLSVDANHIELRRRNWHLISIDTENLHFQNVTGLTVDKHLFGATLIVKSTGSDSIYIHGFWKKRANEIKDICSLYISSNTQKGSTEALAEAISKAVGGANGRGQVSVADELKKLKDLLDVNVLTQKEFDEQKRRLMS